MAFRSGDFAFWSFLRFGGALGDSAGHFASRTFSVLAEEFAISFLTGSVLAEQFAIWALQLAFWRSTLQTCRIAWPVIGRVDRRLHFARGRSRVTSSHASLII